MPQQYPSDLLAKAFLKYWDARCPSPVLRQAMLNVAQDSFMAGAISVMGYFLGDPLQTEDMHTAVLAELARETGLHALRLGAAR